MVLMMYRGCINGVEVSTNCRNFLGVSLPDSFDEVRMMTMMLISNNDPTGDHGDGANDGVDDIW